VGRSCLKEPRHADEHATPTQLLRCVPTQRPTSTLGWNRRPPGRHRGPCHTRQSGVVPPDADADERPSSSAHRADAIDRVDARSGARASASGCPRASREIATSDPRSPDFGVTVQKTQRAVAALLAGDPEPEKALWSRRDDITLANPAGGFRRGWDQVETGLDLAASGFAGGRTCTFEAVHIVAGTDVSYVFEFERFESNITEAPGVISGALRVVMIFRLEDGDWKLVHRQADTLTHPIPEEREPS